MPIILTKVGSVQLMEFLRDPIDPSFLDGMGLALFVNNFIPTWDSVLADFTEASFPGYAPQSLSTPNAAFQNGQGRGEVDADQVTFTASGPSAQTAFGYFVYNAALDVIWCERFAAPQPMGAPGSALDIGVKFTGSTEFTG